MFCCTDPVEVIGLYKGLLPSEFQSSLNNLHPTEPPPLEGEALTRATKCLIDFLNQVQCFFCFRCTKYSDGQCVYFSDSLCCFYTNTTHTNILDSSIDR